MNLPKIFICMFLFIKFSLSCSEIRIVCTAALINAHFEFRKQQYIEAFNQLFKYGYTNIYIVEAVCKQGPSFLENFSKNVFYSTVNDPSLRNQGINEAKTLLEGCINFNFDPEDVIIKLTGRHQIVSDYFLKIVKNNPDYDVFVKLNEDENVFTLGFAMKYKYLKEMYETMDFSELNELMLPIEYRVGDYIKRKKKEGNFKVYYLDKLDMKANLFGSSTCVGATEQVLYY